MNRLDNFRLVKYNDQVFLYLAAIILLIPLAITPYLTIDEFDIVKSSIFYFGVGISLLYFAKNNEILRYNKTLTILLLGLFLASVLNLLTSGHLLTSLMGARQRWTGLFFYFAWLVFIFMMVHVLNYKKALTIMRILVIAGTLNSILALLQIYGIGFYEGIYTADQLLRPPALIGNPNFLSIFTAVICPFAIALAVISQNLKARILYSIASVLIIWATIFIGSRGAVLALMAILLVSTLLFFKKVFDRRLKFYFGSFLILSVIIFYFFGSLIRPDTGFEGTDKNSLSRLSFWQMGIDSMLEDPLGKGLGNFQLIYQENNHLDWNAFFDDAHNIFIQLGSTGGVIFLLFFVGINANALFNSYKNIKNDDGYIFVLIFSSLIGLIIAASFSPVTITNLVLWGILIALASFPSKHGSFSLEKKPVYVYARIVAVLLMVMGFVFVLSESLTHMGHKAYKANKLALANNLLVTSKIINPYFNPGTYTTLAKIEIKLDKPSESVIGNAERLIEISPKLAETYVEVGNIYYLLYAKNQDLAYLQKAADNTRHGLKLDPLFKDAHTRLAFYYLISNNIPKAQTEISYSLQRKPNDINSWIFLAHVYYIQGRLPAAIEALNKVNELDKFGTIRIFIKPIIREAERSGKIENLPFSINFD